ncbi:MAG: hypothetical protein CMJ32_10225 [Phycisphaerae bacterium]|nr:hypothetical protein [Phycisphaerae bacterium]
MIDTHCHLGFNHFIDKVDEVLKQSKEVGVRAVITVSTTSENCETSRALAEAHDMVFFSAGVHPLHVDEPLDWDVVRNAGAHPRCVAWGELGLDKHYKEPDYALQREILECQLDHIRTWSNEGLDKPIIVHSRKSFDDLIPVLGNSGIAPERFVFHCFTGTPEQATDVLDFGARISFAGAVTFKTAPEVAEAAKLVPEDMVMVETDAPFLSPEPVRSMRPNVPANVVHIGRFIAEIRGRDPLEFERRLDANSIEFFGLPLQADPLS